MVNFLHSKHCCILRLFGLQVYTTLWNKKAWSSKLEIFVNYLLTFICMTLYYLAFSTGLEIVLGLWSPTVAVWWSALNPDGLTPRVWWSTLMFLNSTVWWCSPQKPGGSIKNRKREKKCFSYSEFIGTNKRHNEFVLAQNTYESEFNQN